MNSELPASAGSHPLISAPDEVGDEEFDDLKRMLKLEAVVDFAIETKMRTTYKSVALASGWDWRDARFHEALERLSEKSMARGGGAKSAVVCRATSDGAPVRPGRKFYETVERVRDLAIRKLANGDFDLDDAERVWTGEMGRLGYEVAADLASSGTLERFVAGPLSVAAALDRGACGGSYAEACILISGLISAVASFVWPGEGFDRKRFVEAWVRFGTPSTVKVSVPLLRAALLADGQRAEAQTLEQMRIQMFGAGYSARVLTGEDVDAAESDVAKQVPAISTQMIRRHTYPALFYRHVRSKLVHEYELNGRATPHPMTTRKAGVSYANRMLSMPGTTLETVQRDRRIHFTAEWLINVARTIAKSADAALAIGPIDPPARWWIDA